MENKCKWIHEQSLLYSTLHPTCDSENEAWSESFFDRAKIKYCPYCGKEVVKTKIFLDNHLK